MRRCITLAVIGAVALTCGLANADIGIDLKDSNNIQSTAGTWLAAGAYVQLIWSADAVYSGFGGGGSGIDQTSASASSGTYLSQYGDYVLWAGVTPDLGGWYTAITDLDGNNQYANSDVGGANINSGYVFAYVYIDGTPAQGEIFARSTMIGDGTPSGLSDISVLPPDELDVAPSATLVLDTGPSGGFTVQPDIPEPGTLALFGLGLLTLAVRRKRRK